MHDRFDITMGKFDGAELVGIFILHKLSQIVQKENIGLYDGLIFFRNSNCTLLAFLFCCISKINC